MHSGRPNKIKLPNFHRFHGLFTQIFSHYDFKNQFDGGTNRVDNRTYSIVLVIYHSGKKC